MRSSHGITAWASAPLVLLLGLACANPDEPQAPSMETPDVPSQAVVPTNGLIGEWKLDESGSATVAVDTKNGFNADVEGGAAFIAGQLGNALNLNNGTAGTGGKYAEMPTNATLDNVQEGNYTLSAWFHPYSVPADASQDNRNWAIVLKAGQNLGLVYTNDQTFAMRHYLTGDVLVNVGSSTTHGINAWYHVAGVVDKGAGSVKVYVNGTLRGTGSFTGGTAAKEYNAKPWRIGRAQNAWAANGRVDQVRIYNRALTVTEVGDLAGETVSSGLVVTTSAPNALGWNKATLNGSANPGGSAATGWFRYSTTNPGSCNDTFGTRVPATGGTSLGSGSSPVAYNRTVTGLTAGVLYHYCAVASNAGGTGVGSVQTFRAGGNGLRFGLSAFEDLGEGPGGDTGAPIYSMTLLSPQPNDIDNLLADAEQHDVVLLLNLARGRNQWAPNGQYNPALYEANVREFEDNDSLAAAIARRRVLLYVVDEANHSFFNGTISPQEVNEMGLLHKEIWDGAVTVVRMSGKTLTEGWDTYTGPPAGGYTGLDYGYLQYSGQHTTGTFAQAYADDRDYLDDLNMGLIPGLNWWAGGIGHRGESMLDGVPACWDINDNNSSSGYIVGIDQTDPDEGEHFNCNQLPAQVTRTVASPAWIERWADVVAADANAPFAAIWRDALDGSTIPGAEALAARADYVAALDDAITTMAGRTTWNGFRPLK